MQSKYIWASALLFGVFGGWGVQACGSSSSTCAESRSCAPSAEAGAAGEAGSAEALGAAGASGGAAGAAEAGDAGAAAAGAPGAGLACTTDAQCDDGLRCNGVETCAQGICSPGSAPMCDNASSCVESATLAACAYPDPSAWLAYSADEDTPGAYELYVVKQALIGKQAPIKVNAGLPDDVSKSLLPFSLTWSPDRQWLLFQASADEQQTVTHTYAVNFASGRPGAPLEISKDLPAGYVAVTFSPSGHRVLAQVNHAAYWLDLTAGTPPKPIQINALGSHVLSSLWTQRGARILYTTDDGLVNVADATDQGPSPSKLLTKVAEPVDAYFASADGNWVVFLGENDRQTFIARAAAGEPLRPIGGTDFTGAVFSPDSRYLAYSASDPGARSSSVRIIDLQNEALFEVVLEQGQALSSGFTLGAWSADSSSFLYYEDGVSPSPDEKTVVLYAPATGKRIVSPFVVGVRDYPIGISPKGLFMIRYQHAPNQAMELLALSSSSAAYDFAQNTAGTPYLGVEFNVDGSEAIMCTGPSDASDMFFLDLRGASNFPQPIRVPGEGSAENCYADFAPDGKGFAYYRFSPDGSRVLNWVDSSKQVLGKPVPITRAGRVRNYTWQK